ncbi:CapA family protein [Alkalibacter rhizosphaerae]|uniref:CapA family protein n=1 Tax=Alkalibacter rhizosphaerae TaxID=2815577 RepID=A0A975AH31_9FIRM|nr:CapA family protein [Alkalibacter rhizosphaerae]QSX08017.1 CapA family protein [Alkalibacter rhizosphaerae]
MKRKRNKNIPGLAVRLVIVIMVVLVGIQLFQSREETTLGQEAAPSVQTPSDSYIDGFFTTPDGKPMEYTQTVRLASTGDIMTHGTQINGAYDRASGAYDFKPNFVHVKKYFESAHMPVANLETVTAGGTPQGYPVFNAPDAILDAVQYAGIRLLGTANNHSLDKGKSGLLRTLDQLKSRGLLSTGSFREPEQEITTMEENGVKVGFLAYTYGLNGLDGYLTDQERSYMINLIDEDKIRSDIQKAKEQGCDAVAVLIHWGNEYQQTPNAQQKDLAEKMLEWGVDVIFGSHPHVIQPSEMVEVDGAKKYVIYSQGNFLSNQRRETLPSIGVRNYTEDGVIVHVGLEKDPIRNSVVIRSVSYTPTWVHRYATDTGQQYEILPVREMLLREDTSASLRSRLEESYNNTKKNLTMYNGDLDG